MNLFLVDIFPLLLMGGILEQIFLLFTVVVLLIRISFDGGLLNIDLDLVLFMLLQFLLVPIIHPTPVVVVFVVVILHVLIAVVLLRVIRFHLLQGRHIAVVLHRLTTTKTHLVLTLLLHHRLVVPPPIT